LGVSQNESVHPKLESQTSLDENPESKQTLGELASQLFLNVSNIDQNSTKPGEHAGTITAPYRLLPVTESVALA
jgi:hypothetical protein